MHIKITRMGSTPMGTFGELVIYNDVDIAFKCYTVERPWINNEPMISCIPNGDYILSDHESRRFGDTYAIVGETVSHWSTPNFKRSTCLFHAANHFEQINGCIGLGDALGFVSNNWAVLSSKKTVNSFLDYLHSADRDEQHTLSIVWDDASV